MNKSNPSIPTKTEIEQFVRTKLASDQVWATKALVRIYRENQTSSEHASHTASVDNGIGFTGVDAEFLSSLAEAYIRWGKLTPKQLPFVFKKMPKYWKQVVAMSDTTALNSIVLSARSTP